MEKTDNEMQQILESQLHEQYAINNNSNLTSIVALFGGLMAIFGAYGYVFIHSTVEFDFEKMFQGENYTLDALFVTAMASLVIIAIMKHICLYQGFHQRYEQFITYAIRFKYYKQKPENIRPRLFPDNYSPFNKKYKDIPQGLYGEFLSFLCWINMLIFLSILAKLLIFIVNYSFNKVPVVSWLELLVLLIIELLCHFHMCCLRCKLKCNYFLLSQQYRYLNNNDITGIEDPPKLCESISNITNYVDKLC